MTAPAPPRQLEAERPTRAARWLAGTCIVATAAAMLVALVAFTSGEAGGRVVTSAPVSAGVQPVLVDGVAYVIRRDGDHAVAFPGGDARRDMLQWCSEAQVFTGINWGSVFSAEGELVSGPAGYGLTRIPATVEHDARVTLHPERAEPGHNRRGEPDPDPWYPRVGNGWLHRFANPSYCPG
jgi:hypothetical protein